MASKKLSNRKSTKVTEAVDEVITVVESRSGEYVNSLKELADIYSSTLVADSNRSSLKVMSMKRAVAILKEVGVEVEEVYQFSFKRPGCGPVPLVLASLHPRPEKPTVLVYCQMDGSGERPVFPSSGKYVRGRAVHEAAAFLIWVHMISAHRQAGVPLPCNFKFCLDACSGREVTQLINVMSRRVEFFESDLCVACVSQGLGGATPEIVYGFRGICNFYFRITKGSSCDDPDQIDNQVMLDALHLLNCLKDSDGKVTVEGFEEDVDEVTEEQRTWLSSIDFNSEKLSRHFNISGVSADDKSTHLEKLWCRPAIVVRGLFADQEVEGLLGGFTVMTVPHQTPKAVRRRVLRHLADQWKQRDSCNSLELGMDYWSWPWRADESSFEYRALAQVISTVYGQWPQAIMSGAHLPFPPILKKLTGKNVAVFTLGSFLDQQLTDEERISVREFINGIKLVSRLVHSLDK